MSFWKDLYGRVFSLSDKDCQNRSVRPEDRNQSAVAGKKRKASTPSAE